MVNNATETRGHFLQPDWVSSSYRERFESVRPHIAGKSVLDLGAGSGHHRDDWVHLLLQEHASEVTGVELSPEFVDAARERGVELILGNAEEVRLGRTFDVVFAGELIEHLSCFSGFINTARAHLEPGGRFIITTPNAFAVSNFVYRFGGRARVHSEHTCWFCDDTLAHLVERHGFRVESVDYLRHHTPCRVRRWAASAVRAPLPDRLAHNTLLMVAELVDPLRPA